MSEQKKVWIQYLYSDDATAVVVQTANSKEEAEKADADSPGRPWYHYDIVPPAYKGGDCKLENEEGPFYFGVTECVPEYRSWVSGLWYRKSGAAGSICAVRCTRCNKTLLRDEEEPGLKWVHRFAEWWSKHKEEKED